MIDTVLFDLDGTLLPLDQDVFIETYVRLLVQTMVPYGYEPKAFSEALMKSTHRVLLNDGSYYNEEVFWRSFQAMLGERILASKPILEEFYRTEFEKVRSVCSQNPAAVKLVRSLRAEGYTVALATSPVFPRIATEARIRWAGLSPDDFAYITTYENSRACKPNPAYYTEVAEKLGAEPSRCLMVGNDTLDDLAAEKTGMKVFLLTDRLLNREGREITSYPQGSFKDLETYLKAEGRS